MVKKVKVSQAEFDAMVQRIKKDYTTDDGYVYHAQDKFGGYIVQSFLVTYNAPNGDITAYSPMYETHYAVGKKVFKTEDEARQFSKDLMARGALGGWSETFEPVTHIYLGDLLTESLF